MLRPDMPFTLTLALPAGRGADLRLRVSRSTGTEVIAYRPDRPRAEPPEAATEPPEPADIASVDELYVTGLHMSSTAMLLGRRTPTGARRSGAIRWRAAATTLWVYGASDAANSLRQIHFCRALQRLLRRNPNPYDGEALYNLGLTLRYLGRDDEAYAAFYKRPGTRLGAVPAFTLWPRSTAGEAIGRTR